jgi:hypothetical protein
MGDSNYGVLPSVTPGQTTTGATIEVVSSRDVATMSLKGFTVTEVIKRATPEVREVALKTTYAQQYGQSEGWQNGRGTFPGEEVLFLMVRSKDAAESEQAARIEELWGQLNQAEAARDAANARAVDLENKLAGKNAELDSSERARITAANEVHALQERIRKYEGDMARLQKEIGAGRVREILVDVKL